MMKHLKSNKGVGLVEAVLALLIFAVGISLALRSLPAGTEAMIQARNTTSATNYAQQKLEQLIDLPSGAADLSAGQHNDSENPIDGYFVRSWNVINDSPAPGMKTVTVTVQGLNPKIPDQSTVTTFLRGN